MKVTYGSVCLQGDFSHVFTCTALRRRCDKGDEGTKGNKGRGHGGDEEAKGTNWRRDGGVLVTVVAVVVVEGEFIGKKVPLSLRRIVCKHSVPSFSF